MPNALNSVFVIFLFSHLGLDDSLIGPMTVASASQIIQVFN
jgi:hypothetical protein